MALSILRGVFIVVAAAVGASLATKFDGANPWLIFFSVVGAALAVIVADLAIRRKHLDIISSVYFGMIVGLFFSYVAGLAIQPVLPDSPALRDAIQLVLGMVLVYLCTSLLIQTRNDFRFIIPYVEFARQVKGQRPFVLDTSVVIDGRIADIVETKILDNRLIMPQFVLAELQAIADSSDRIRRSRGRRGLDILQRLQSNKEVELEVFDRDLPELHGHPVDLKLVLLAKHLDGKIVTNDYNLNKVAQLHGVEVVNLNSIASALKPAYLPGEELTVKIIKPGEEQSQGVGYLEDGTMVVVENARQHMNKRVLATVTSTLQTSAGRMIFSRCEKVEAGRESGTGGGRE